jgi:hypothetical protein
VDLPASGEDIERAHAQIDTRTEARAGGRNRRISAHPARCGAARDGAAAIDGLAQRIDHPADPAVIDRDRRTLPQSGSRRAAQVEPCPAAWANAIQRAEGHCLGAVVAEADDFRKGLSPVPPLEHQAVAD